MKKYLFLICCFAVIGSGEISAQTSPPPLYETEEELPKDLAIEKLPPKKKPTLPPQQPPAQPQETPPAEIKPTETVTQPEPKTKPEEKIKVEAKEVEIKPEPVVEPPPQPEITVPEDVPVVSPTPAPQAPVTPPAALQEGVPPTAQPPAITPLVGTPLQDGGPLKDAGNELLSALSVTYSQYESNFLSPVDSVDTFKIYTRSQEGVGVILKPKHLATHFACDLLGEQGELLSQTQASGPGQPLAFQTSPFEKNGIIYLQVRDSNLPADSPVTEQREYSLELKPIVVIAPESPPAPPPAPTPVEQSKDETLFRLPENFWHYGLAGFAFLVLVIFLIVLIRRRRKKDERI